MTAKLQRKTVRGLVYPEEEEIAKWKGADHPSAGAYFHKSVCRDLNIGKGWYYHKTLHQCRLGENVWYVHIQLMNISRVEWEKRKNLVRDIWVKAQEENLQVHMVGKMLYDVGIYPFEKECYMYDRICDPSWRLTFGKPLTMEDIANMDKWIRHHAWKEKVYESIYWHYQDEHVRPRENRNRQKREAMLAEMQNLFLELVRTGDSVDEARAVIEQEYPYNNRDDRVDYCDLAFARWEL